MFQLAHRLPNRLETRRGNPCALLIEQAVAASARDLPTKAEGPSCTAGAPRLERPSVPYESCVSAVREK